MFLLKWYREYLTIRSERVCEGCEVLRHQLEVSNYEKKQLLDRLLERPEPIIEKPPVAITPPTSLPWRARRQILEAEDREKARAMREAAKPDATVSVEELEKEMNVVEKARENA